MIQGKDSTVVDYMVGDVKQSKTVELDKKDGCTLLTCKDGEFNYVFSVRTWIPNIVGG